MIVSFFFFFRILDDGTRTIRHDDLGNTTSEVLKDLPEMAHKDPVPGTAAPEARTLAVGTSTLKKTTKKPLEPEDE